MNKSIISYVLVFLLSIIVIAGCKAAGSDISTAPLDAVINTYTSDTANVTETEPFVTETKPAQTFCFEWDEWHNIKSGKLMFTLSNPRVTKNWPEEGGFYGQPIWFADEKNNVFAYPDFINADGTLIEGVYLILLDVSVVSNDAICYTSDYFDPETYYSGTYEDPYLFSAGHIGFFTDMGKNDGMPINYYSELGKYQDTGEFSNELLLFRILPGETLEFTIGMVFTEESYNGIMNISKIHFTETSNGTQGYDYNLELSIP